MLCGINGRPGVLQKMIAMLFLLFGLAHALDGSSGHSRHMLKFAKSDNVTTNANAATLETAETKGKGDDTQVSEGDDHDFSLAPAYLNFIVGFQKQNKKPTYLFPLMYTDSAKDPGHPALVGHFTNYLITEENGEVHLQHHFHLDELTKKARIATENQLLKSFKSGEIVLISSPAYHPRGGLDMHVHTRYSVPGVQMKNQMMVPNGLKWSQIRKIGPCDDLLKTYVEVYGQNEILFQNGESILYDGGKRLFKGTADVNTVMKDAEAKEDNVDRFVRLNFVNFLGLGYQVLHGQDTGDFATFNMRTFDKYAEDVDVKALFENCIKGMRGSLITAPTKQYGYSVQTKFADTKRKGKGMGSEFWDGVSELAAGLVI